MMNDSVCVSCGRYVPEGRMICSLCENETNNEEIQEDVSHSLSVDELIKLAESNNKLKLAKPIKKETEEKKKG